MGNTVFGEKSSPQPFSAVTSPVGKATLDFLDWHSFFFFFFFVPQKNGALSENEAQSKANNCVPSKEQQMGLGDTLL